MLAAGIAARAPKAAPRRLLEHARHVPRGRTVGARRETRAPPRRRASRRTSRSNWRAADGVGQRGEGVEIVERLGDLRRAAMAVAHLAGEPARIGGAAAQRARDLLFERAHLRRRRRASNRDDRARASRRAARPRRRSRLRARRRRRRRARPARAGPARGRTRPRRRPARGTPTRPRGPRPRRHRRGWSPRDRPRPDPPARAQLALAMRRPRPTP